MQLHVCVNSIYNSTWYILESLSVIFFFCHLCVFQNGFMYSVATFLVTPVQSNTIQYSCADIKSTFMMPICLLFVDTVINVFNKLN